MATVPDTKYTVQLFTNTWANGELDTTVKPPTYTTASAGSGQVHGWHHSTVKMGWKIGLTPPGANAPVTITFSNGHYYPKQKPQVQLGKVSGFPPGPGADPEDTWTANSAGVGVESGESEAV